MEDFLFAAALDRRDAANGPAGASGSNDRINMKDMPPGMKM
jgi:hypothetical protein